MKIIDIILDLFYPPRCAFCHKFVESSEGIFFPQCRKVLPYTHGEGQRKKVAHTDKCLSPLYYEGLVRQSLLRYKFHSATAYAAVYGEILSKYIDENGISCDIITWIPLSKKRKRTRGYDQAELIAEEIARIKGLKCVPLIRKVKDTKAQSKTGNAEKRRANISGAYSLCSGAEVKDKRILLVDDIVTTGSTFAEAASVLKKAGASELVAVAVARKRD